MKKEKHICKIEWEEDWMKSKYVPSEGEIVIVKFHGGNIKIRIGDGVTNVNLLPYLDNKTSVDEENHSLQL